MSSIREANKNILHRCYEFGFDEKITSGVGDDGMTRYTCVFNETRALEELETYINKVKEEVVNKLWQVELINPYYSNWDKQYLLFWGESPADVWESLKMWSIKAQKGRVFKYNLNWEGEEFFYKKGREHKYHKDYYLVKITKASIKGETK